MEALGLAEWKPAFEKHRVQGDVMFALSEPALLEIGVTKIGDRLYLVDCLQSLHEEVTSWKTGQGSRSEPRQLGGGPTSGPVTGLPSGATGAAAARHAAQEEEAQAAQGLAAAQQQRVPQIAGAARGGSTGASYGVGAGGGVSGYGGAGGGGYGGGGGGSYGGGSGGGGAPRRLDEGGTSPRVRDYRPSPLSPTRSPARRMYGPPPMHGGRVDLM